MGRLTHAALTTYMPVGTPDINVGASGGRTWAGPDALEMNRAKHDDGPNRGEERKGNKAEIGGPCALINLHACHVLVEVPEQPQPGTVDAGLEVDVWANQGAPAWRGGETGGAYGRKMRDYGDRGHLQV